MNTFGLEINDYKLTDIRQVLECRIKCTEEYPYGTETIFHIGITSAQI